MDVETCVLSVNISSQKKQKSNENEHLHNNKFKDSTTIFFPAEPLKALKTVVVIIVATKFAKTFAGK